MFGLAGISTLKKADNPLVNSDLNRNYAVSADLYLEFLKLEKRSDTKWGSITPTFGIKTKLEWDFYRADNSKDGGSESFGLNYLSIPVLFEYCLSYHQGVTTASHTPGETVYHGSRNSDGSVTVTENYTPGTYSRGGAKTSGGTFIYLGPKICNLFQSFNYSGNPIKDPNLINSYVGIVGGFNFCLHQLNFDLSYQKGLSSIYKGKDITIDGFMLTVGINFTSRLYNK
ncbi:hypothetical protein GALL_55590 [mine drainage metagenome]|uniref:Outer membrane protein beta-barrel domain-containing protein n=1 Tax=mine drainage metagenome TaxID=410659 RepID=A0A1J5TMD7_9ZZZZ